MVIAMIFSVIKKPVSIKSFFTNPLRFSLRCGVTLLLLCLTFFAVSKGLKSDKIDGYIVAINKTENAISITDTLSGEIIKTLSTGKGPHELVMSNDYKKLVSTDFVGGNSLTVFEVNTFTIDKTISLEQYKGPHGIQFLPGSNHIVAVTSGQSEHVLLVDIIHGDIIEAIPTSQKTSHMLSFDALGEYLYVTNIRSNTISKIKVDSASLVKNIAVQDMPEAIKYSRKRNELWYGANQNGIVEVLDVEKEQVVANFDGFIFPYRVLFNHNEDIALVPDFRQHTLTLIDARKKSLINRYELPEGSGPQGITLHPSHDIVFLSLNLSHEVIAIDIMNQEILARYPTGKNPDGVVFIPRSKATQKHKSTNSH